MKKEFNIKIYDFSGKYKNQLTKFSGNISWSESINGGQGNITLDIFDIKNFKQSDIVEIREISDLDKQVKPAYTGIINSINEIDNKDGKKYNIQILGIFTILNDKLFQSESNLEFTLTDTPGNIVKNIIDYFNISYGNLYGDTANIETNIVKYTNSSIDTSGDTISIKFSKNNCLESIKKCIEITAFQFYIGADGIIYFKKKPINNNQTATYRKDIISVDKQISKDILVNRLYLDNGTELKTYNNISSQNKYGIIEKYLKKDFLGDTQTMDEYANNYLNLYTEVIEEIKLEIKIRNSNDIKPGDSITTYNTLEKIENQEIIKIDKNSDKFILYLGNYKSLGELLLRS